MAFLNLNKQNFQISLAESIPSNPMVHVFRNFTSTISSGLLQADMAKYRNRFMYYAKSYC